MSLWTWRPGWNPLDELQRQVDQFFDLSADVARKVRQAWRQFPAFNLFETATAYLVATPLPGVKPEDLDISVVGATITLKVERKRPDSVPDEAYRRQERVFGKWSRTMTAPDKADLSQINAALENGILILTIPKAAASQPRQVPVRVHNHQRSRPEPVREEKPHGA